MCVSLPDVALNLKPVTSIMHCTCSKAISSQVKLDCSIIQSTQRKKIQDPIRLACDHGAIAEQSWKLYSKTTWKISTTFGGSGLFFRWKENYLSCHLKSWFGPRSHFTTFAHHVITLKDKRIEQLNITIHHKQEGAVWCHTTNGCTAEIPATC